MRVRKDIEVTVSQAIVTLREGADGARQNTIMRLSTSMSGSAIIRDVVACELVFSRIVSD